MEPKTKSYVRLAIKAVSWVLGGILVLIILTMVALQFPGVQRIIAQKLFSSISQKTNTRVEIGSVTIALTHSVVLRNIFIESRQRDTLLSIQTLAADVNLFSLFSSHVNVRNVRIDSLTAHITRSLPDSSYNFEFIIDALSSPSTTPDAHPDTSAGPGWHITLGGVSLNGVHATYDDEVSGLHAHLQLGSLKASIDKFDLDKNKIHLDELSLANASASVVQGKESPPDGSTSADFDFGIGSLSLSKIRFKYEDVLTRESYIVDLGTSALLAETVDLPSHHIAVKNFLLENTNVAIVPPKENNNQTPKPGSTALPWVISLGRLTLNNNSVQYDVQGAATTKGLDLNHLRLDGLTMRAGNMHYSGNHIAADIHQASFREHSGIELHELSGGFKLDSLHAQLTDFTVATATSRIHQNTLLSYSSLSALRNFPGTVSVKATFSDSHVALSDLLSFLPALPMRNIPGASIVFSSKLSGFVRDLHIEEFRATTGDSTTVDLTGSILGLPEVEKTYYDVNLRLLSSGRKDIQALLADSLLPKSIVLPATMTMSGTYKGTLKSFSVSSVIETSIGNVQGTLAMISGPGPGSRDTQWKTDVNVEEFNIGSLLNDPETFGPVSMKISAAGTGLNKDNVDGQINVLVDKAVVLGYPYRHILLDGTARPNRFDVKSSVQDSNIVFALTGSASTSGEDPTYKFTLDVKGADLRRLNLSADDIRVAGTMTSNLTGRNIQDLLGTIDVRNVVIIKDGKHYTIDSVVYASLQKEGKTHVTLESTVFAGQFDGSMSPGNMPKVLKEHFAHYFTMQGEQRQKDLQGKAFTFHVTVRDPSTLTNIFFPQLHHLSAGTIEGKYSGNVPSLSLNIDIPRLDYNDLRIDSLALRVTSNADLLQATLKMGSIADSMFRVTNLQLVAKGGHDSIEVALKSTRKDGLTKLLLAGVVTSVPDGYTFRFNEHGIVFQDLPWNIPPDNYLLFGKNQFVAHHVVLQSAGQSVSLQSMDEKVQRSPLKIEFKSFDLATLSQVVERRSRLLGGILTGNVVLQNMEHQMAFTSDLAAKGFSLDQRLIGDVTLHASNQTENVYEVSMDIAGNGNQIDMKGTYRSKEGGSELDLTSEFTNVNLSSIEPFTFGTVQRLSGTMTGGLHLTGTRKKPFVTGELNFTNAAFSPTFLKSYLHLNNGKLAFDGTGVEFKAFELLDTLGNKASLSGRLSTENFRFYSFDVKVHTDKFLVMNKPASRDALYYGTAILNSDISVKGDQRRPIITMRAELDKGTNLTLVLPESELAVEERKGIVTFVDVQLPSNSIMSRQDHRTERDTTETDLSSLDLTSNLTVNKDSRLRILIDPVAGDSLVIQGEATLSFTIDPSGKLTLTGRYDILKGSYQLSFADVIKRDFAITEGSSLTWFGSPYEADVDITAMYTVKASVLELIQDQLAGISQEERNKYKQELPIQVYLMMKGKLLKPDIHFRLDLPPEQRGVLSGSVYAKLNELNGQESELNKQVFALLVLSRFVPENPLASSGGTGGLSDFARSSGSQILSSQLNRLSEQYIAGANLNVGLDSYQDYSTGTAEGRTQLKLALSKQLFDERVTVQVGGNVDLEGRRSQENSLNNFAGDLKVLYKLTEDGRWQLQVFRQNSYEGAIDGDITKTGVGVVFMIDFDKLFGITLQPALPEEKK